MTRRNVLEHIISEHFCCCILYVKNQGVLYHLRHYTSWGYVRDFQLCTATKALGKLVVWAGKIILPSFCCGVAPISGKLFTWNEWGKKNGVTHSNLSPLVSFCCCSSCCFPCCQYQTMMWTCYLFLYSYYIPQNKYHFLKWRVRI